MATAVKPGWSRPAAILFASEFPVDEKAFSIAMSEAAEFNADKEIKALLAEVNADDGAMNPYFGKYTSQKAAALKAQSFDRSAISKRGLKYELLDQLTSEILLGVR